MDNNTESNGNAGSLSQDPAIRSFEFDKTAIGNIKSSVNKFRGSVSLPMDFLTLQGREGLDIKLSALYSSTIRKTLDTWNLDAPTGILGLGWQMPVEMIAVEKAGSRSSTSDTYYLVSGGSANPMIKTGETSDRKWIFQLRNYEFWSVQYDPSAKTWTIIKENGYVYTYGAGSDPGSNATHWGVSWGNWIGSSSQRAAQSNYPLAWNLASIVTPLGSKVLYRYQNVNQKVMSSGLEYTQASYFKEIIDSYGRKITFNYGNKYGALNPDNTPGRSPVVEYQARHTQQAAPNAYQERYETCFLDSVDVANRDGEALYGIKFTYTFINRAPTGDANYSLMYKRCLQSVFQYSPDGETLPAMAFEYVDINSSTNPGALSAVVYPEGGRATFGYKQNYIKSPKKITLNNPLPGSIPRVWFGSDYVVFTYCKKDEIKVVVQSWDGQWVTQDVTGIMAKNPADSGSLMVLTGRNFFTVSFRNKSTHNDELYLFRNDDRGEELRFGKWVMYKNEPFVISLKGKDTGASTFVAGDSFVIGYNKDYTAGPVQGFSYTWQDGRWNRDSGYAPPVPPSSDTQCAAITACQNYYAVSCYLKDTKQLKNYIFYRNLDGTWKRSTSNPWTINDFKVLMEKDLPYLAISPMPSGLVLTHAKSNAITDLYYGLKIFVWDDDFHVLNASSPVSVDLSSPMKDYKPVYQIFKTEIVDALVNNNLLLLRNIGGEQSLTSSWMQKFFTKPKERHAKVEVVCGEDCASFYSTTDERQANQLITFNPNNNLWSTPSVLQSEKAPTISGDYMTIERNIYFRKTDGAWGQLTAQLSNLCPETLQNRGPQYMAYQDATDGSASTFVVALKNGGAKLLSKISARKMYVPSDQYTPGVMLAGGRFLVTYPSSAASFDESPSMDLYAIDEVNLDQYVVDYPVAYVEIEDAYDATQSYYQSFFYANSSESQIVYNAATGVTQYPMVTVVYGVKEISESPPQQQPEGWSRFYYSNGLAHQRTLYPAGGIQNYQYILNGMELGKEDYDADNNLVSSQLNYWKVCSRDSSGKNLYGGYARCERVVLTMDGVEQQSTAGYDSGTGMTAWQEKTYYDAQGSAKKIRTESLYAWEVPEYATAFKDLHLYSAVAMTTKSVSPADDSSKTYIQAQATTYRNWADATKVTIDCAGDGLSRLAPYETFDWTTPGNKAPQFPSVVPAPAGWRLKTRIVLRSEPHGMIVEQEEGNGLISSFIYDKDQTVLTARFPNASISGDEVSYYGFEAKEADNIWVMGAGASIIPNAQSPILDAHTGRRSLSIAASTTGTAGIAGIFRPARQDLQYLFSAWVKKPSGFNNALGNASWKITVAGGTPSVLNFPETVGKWVYVCKVICLPDPSGSSQIEISCENGNTACNVLVDDLRFSPLACPMEAYAYESRFDKPTAVIGPNGETKRTVYDNFQQELFTTNPADRTDRIIKLYFSLSGNQGKFVPADPNHTLTIDSASDGSVTGFTRGTEWEAFWEPQADVWQVDNRVLTQKAGGLAGQLTCADKALDSKYALGIEFNILETLTSPIGIRLGTELTVQWDPGSTAWKLQNSSGEDVVPQVDARAFCLPSAPYSTELDGCMVSDGLCSAFWRAGYLLPANSIVSAGAASGKGWTLASPDKNYCYALKVDGSQIAVYAMNRHWLLFSGENAVSFLADGKLIFSYTTSKGLSLLPTLFFGNRVSISHIATACNPQASITFDDGRGVSIQTQNYGGAQMIVSQDITDDMGRAAVCTKPAWVTSGQIPMFRYCAGFAAMNWQTGTMTGLVHDAYPADQGYPFSRQTFETSPLARMTEESVPGAVFRVGGGHSTRYSYSACAGDDGTSIYFKKTTANPNGDLFYEVSTQLDQVIRRVYNKGGTEIKNESIYDEAGNAGEVRSPNYFNPPDGSTPRDWTTVQTFDYANRLLTSQPGAQSPIRVIYDAAGNIRFTQDAQGAKAGTYNYIKYDQLSRQIEAGYLTGTWDHVQLEQYADSDPSWPQTPPTWRKKYSYDGEDGTTNAVGRNTSILANNGSSGASEVLEDLDYDIFGNRIAVTLTVNAYEGGQKNRVDYEYDDLGNILRIVYPAALDGARLNACYQINPLNQITAISQSQDFTKPLAAFSYDAAGNPLENQFGLAGGEGIKQRYTYNPPFWPTDISIRNQAGTDLFRETLTYTEGGYKDAAYYDGTIASSLIQTGGAGNGQDQFHFSYDQVGQLVNAQNPQQPARNLGVTEPVRHDANGNFLDFTAGGTPYRYNYNKGLQQVSSVVDTASSTTIADFEYDGNGNAVRAATFASGLTTDHDLTITYDPAMMLPVKVEDAGSGGCTVNLIYGCHNDRVMKQVSGGTAQSGKKLYIRGTCALPLMERSTDGSAHMEVCYIYGPGGLIAMRKGTEMYHILKDHLGSVRAVLDLQGNIAASYQYLSYGAVTRTQEPTPGFMTYLYTGQEYDEEIGLYNYRARFYCAGLGRFIAIDPGRQYFSPYLYASNNPVMFVDPTGMYSLASIFSAIGGIIIGAVEVLCGIVIDVIAGVAEALTGGLSTGMSMLLGACAGVFYGPGFNAITYSIFHFDDFSWKDYGLQMANGVWQGMLSGGIGPLFGGIFTNIATGITKAAGKAMAGVKGFFGAVSKAAGWIYQKGASFAKYWVGAPETIATGWQFIRRWMANVFISEGTGITSTMGSNLICGNDWYKGLDQTAVNSLLSGSIASLQIRPRAELKYKNSVKKGPSLKLETDGS